MALPTEPEKHQQSAGINYHYKKCGFTTLTKIIKEKYTNQ